MHNPSTHFKIQQYQPSASLLDNRAILITGASDGIGKQAAITYAKYGAAVFLIGKNSDKLHSVQKEINNNGGIADFFCLDLKELTSAKCQELIIWLQQYTLHLDGLLNNASILGINVPILQYDHDIWHDVMQINLHATFLLTQTLLPFLLQAKYPSVIFTSSRVGKKGQANWGAYAVSKFATEGLMQVLADEHNNSNLRVNTINPGGTRTKMRASAFPDENPYILPSPADIMPIYLYLMGDDSLHENGKSFDAQS